MNKSLTIIGGADILTRQAQEIAVLLGYQSVLVREFIDATSDQVFVAKDDAQDRQRILAELPAERLVNLTHPSAAVSPSASLAGNVLIGAQAIVAMNASVGMGVVLNALSSIEHDNSIGACSFLGTGAILCGHVTTGPRVFIGGGATVKPGIRIGAGAILGSGAVLTRDALENVTYIGNPAKPMLPKP